MASSAVRSLGTVEQPAGVPNNPELPVLVLVQYSPSAMGACVHVQHVDALRSWCGQDGS